MYATADALTVLAAEGDLAGNWSWTVWLLIPVALALAVVTALCLGSGGEPRRSERSVGGVSRYLARTATTNHNKEEVR